MAGKIGYRAYKLFIQEKGKSGPLPFSTPGLVVKPKKFIEDFVRSHLTPSQNNITERSWYLEQKVTAPGVEKGLIHYGTFGFESNLVDPKTRIHRYKRKATDVEEIPLYFEIWCPPKADIAFMAFQSFRGKSCILEIMGKMKDEFESRNQGYSLQFRKLMPTNSKGGFYAQLPVKRVRLLKSKAAGNTAERYVQNPPTLVDYEIIISARPRESLGLFSTILSALPKNAKGTVTYEGLEIDEAQADVRIGGQIRKVGLFGSNIEAGVIDLSDSVKSGPDGHPIFDSVVAQSNLLLKEFASILGVVP